MVKATSSGKSDFRNLFEKIIKRPSFKTLKESMIQNKEFSNFLENAQKHFGFKFTEETLDEFMTDWMVKLEELGLSTGGNYKSEMYEEMMAWSDGRLARLGMQSKDPESLTMLNKFKEVFDDMGSINTSIKTKDGKEHKGFKWYDTKKPIKTDNLNKTEKEKEFHKELIAKDSYVLDNDDPTNIYDFKLLNYTKLFCKMAGNNQIPQFQHKADIFRRRLELIETAKPYRFGDSFLPLLIQHNNNDYGFRRMPRDNMWVEVGLKFGNVFVSGIHLAKVFVDTKESGFGSNMFRFYDEIIPSSYTKQAVSVFVVGIENDNTQFYYHFILEESDIELKKLKSRYVYSCPHCSMPMKKLQDQIIYCDKDGCRKTFQGGIKIAYDLSDKKTKEHLRLFEMKSIWKVEDNIRQFATNLLDFLTNKKVQIIDNFSVEELVERNKKRAKRGKSALFPVSVIRVDGTLKEYVSFISKRFRGDYKLARVETPVNGHFYRFKDKSVWTKLYAWIKNCKTDDEIRKRLEELKRVDKDKRPLPDEEQYEWDSHYKLIKVWKLPFYRFKGEGDPRPRIDIINVGDDK